MRTTLSLDDDVAALLEQIRKSKDASFKDIVNEALRLGLTRMTEPPPTLKPFRTEAVNLGRCYFPNLDNVAEVLAVAEGERYK
jgi:hypothetical protein